MRETRLLAGSTTDIAVAKTVVLAETREYPIRLQAA